VKMIIPLEICCLYCKSSLTLEQFGFIGAYS
jgi:hypothetical protein